MKKSRTTILAKTQSESARAPTQDAPAHVTLQPKLMAVPALLTRARRMRSLNLTLVLMGTAALGGLTGCGNLESGGSTSRDVYANMDACKADWGNPGDCEEIQPNRSATGTSSFYGPRYSSRSGGSGYSTTARPGSRSSGTVSSSSASRGGFGASASRHGGGSSASSHSSGG